MLKATGIFLIQLCLLSISIVCIAILVIASYVFVFLAWVVESITQYRAKRLANRYYDGDMKALFESDTYTKTLKWLVQLVVIIEMPGKWLTDAASFLVTIGSYITSWSHRD